MEKLLLLLLLQEQTLFTNKYLSLLKVKTKKEYTEKVFLRKKNQLLWSLCKTEIKSRYIPSHCWKLEKQWAQHFKIKQDTKKSIFSLLDQLCTKNVIFFKKQKNLSKVDLNSLSTSCAKNIKYTLKTILYRNQ